MYGFATFRLHCKFERVPLSYAVWCTKAVEANKWGKTLKTGHELAAAIRQMIAEEPTP